MSHGEGPGGRGAEGGWAPGRKTGDKEIPGDSTEALSCQRVGRGGGALRLPNRGVGSQGAVGLGCGGAG